MRGQKAFFGQGGYPVVFARDHLDRWAASAGEGLAAFADTLTHEVAHWLWWNGPGRAGTDVHDRRWALHAGLLRHLLGNSLPLSIAEDLRHHDLSDAGMAEAGAWLRRGLASRVRSGPAASAAWLPTAWRFVHEMTAHGLLHPEPGFECGFVMWPRKASVRRDSHRFD